MPEWNAAILYVAQKDQLPLESVMSELAADYGAFINVCMLVVEDTNTVNAELKAEFKSTKLP